MGRGVAWRGEDGRGWAGWAGRGQDGRGGERRGRSSVFGELSKEKEVVRKPQGLGCRRKLQAVRQMGGESASALCKLCDLRQGMEALRVSIVLSRAGVLLLAVSLCGGGMRSGA